MPNHQKLFTKAQDMLSKGNIDEAIQCLLKCTKHKTYKARSHALLGKLYGQFSQYDKAYEHLQQACLFNNNSHENWYYLGISIVLTGRSTRHALKAFLKAIDLNNNFEQAWVGAGCAYRDMGNYRSATKYLQTALQLNPQSAATYTLLGNIHRLEGGYQTALDYFDQALSCQPNYIDAIAGKAMANFQCGQLTDAKKLITSLADKKKNNPLIAQAFAEICKEQEPLARQALHYLTTTIKQPSIAPVQRSELHFFAARLCEKLHLFENAYHHAQNANAFLRGIFDRDEYTKHITEIRTAYNTLKRNNIKCVHAETIPIFIVGMPRSGSSLIEQILSCHPQIHGAGELTILPETIKEALKEYNLRDLSDINQEQANTIRNKYLQSISDLAPNKTFITDKLPGNYELLGVINRLFPQSKIIFTLRHKRDTCLSCFFQNFGARHLYSQKLDDTAFVYELHLELMDFWKKEFGDSIFELHYEQLVQTPHKTVSGLLKFLSLEWNDACMNFHQSRRQTRTASFDQVRQPLYTTSTNKWKNYAPYIDWDTFSKS